MPQIPACRYSKRKACGKLVLSHPISIFAKIHAMKNLFLLVFFLSMHLFLFGQSGTFEKVLGETKYYNRGNQVIQTSDGGYAIIGRTVRFDEKSGVNAYLVKTTALGDIQWTKTYGGRGSEEGYSIVQTKDGGYTFVGYTNSVENNTLDVFVVHTAGNGDVLWSKNYGGTGIDRGFSIMQTSDGGYIVSGETYSYECGGVNAYLLRINEKGDTLWSKHFGGNGIEEGRSVIETSDGGFIVTGASNSFDGGDYDVFLIKVDKGGKLLWTQTFGGTGNEMGMSVVETEDSSFAITGYTESFGIGRLDVYFVLTDALGNMKWTKTFGGVYDDFGNSIRETAGGGFVIAGYSNSFDNNKGMEVFLVRTDEHGEELWAKTLGQKNDEFGNSVIQSADGGFVVTGNSISTQINGKSEIEKIKQIYFVKTNAKGIIEAAGEK